MVIKLREEILWGKLKRDIRELKPGEEIMLSNFPPLVEAQVMNVVSEDSVRVSVRSTTSPVLVGIGDISNVNENYFYKEGINTANLPEQTFLNKLLGYRQRVEWTPSPHEASMSPGQKKITLFKE